MMPAAHRAVIGGVDTHKDSHHVAALTTNGVLLAATSFPATAKGHRALLVWLKSHGPIEAVGVEGTGSYGASLARCLTNAGERVVEVNQTNRQLRRARGKSDPLDAEAAARAVLAGTATATPKAKSGPVEAIRVLRVARSTAVKGRTQAMNALHGLIVAAPDSLHDELVELSGRKLVRRCAGLQPQTTDLVSLSDQPDRLVLAATETAIQALAVRWLQLDEQIKQLRSQLEALTCLAAPELISLPGVATEIAGQFLVTAGDNPDRLTSEAAFARLCGVAPQPASSGRTSGRHRLNRGGDRGANTALYMVAITRLRDHQPTRAYVTRRQAEGLTKREIIRCLKRYVAREVFRALPRPALDGT